MINLTIKEFTFDYILLQDKLSTKHKLILGEFVKEASNVQVMHLLLTGKIKSKMKSNEIQLTREIFNDIPLGKMLSEVDNIFEVSAEQSKALLQFGSKALNKLAKMWADFKVSPTIKVFDKRLMIGDLSDIGSELKMSQWNNQFGNASAALHGGTILTGTVIAALLALISRKIYKSYLSKAARSCKSTKGTQKIECLRKFQIDGIVASIKAIKSSRDVCKATNKPSSCIAKVEKRIRKQKIKLQKIMAKKKF